jgi:cytochrome c6
MARIIEHITLVAVLWSFVITSAPAARADDAAAKLYQSKCAACHAKDGSASEVGKKLGARGFHSAEVQAESEAETAQIIAKGKNKMPAYEKSLKPDEIKALAAYVRDLGGKK